MLITIVLILVLLWILGLVKSTTLGGLVHLLIVVAVVMFLFGVFRGRRVA